MQPSDQPVASSIQNNMRQKYIVMIGVALAVIVVGVLVWKFVIPTPVCTVEYDEGLRSVLIKIGGESGKMDFEGDENWNRTIGEGGALSATGTLNRQITYDNGHRYTVEGTVRLGKDNKVESYNFTINGEGKNQACKKN